MFEAAPWAVEAGPRPPGGRPGGDRAIAPRQ